MYAVVNSGGKQYKVQQGQVLRVEKISGDVGNPVAFERVLMFSDGENVSIGQPALEDIAVEGHIVEQGKAKKIIVSSRVKIGTKEATSVVVNPAFKVSETHQVILDGEVISALGNRYIVLNKPAGYICSTIAKCQQVIPKKLFA